MFTPGTNAFADDPLRLHLVSKLLLATPPREDRLRTESTTGANGHEEHHKNPPSYIYQDAAGHSR